MGTMFGRALVWVPSDGCILNTTYNKCNTRLQLVDVVHAPGGLKASPWKITRDGELASPCKKKLTMKVLVAIDRTYLPFLC